MSSELVSQVEKRRTFAIISHPDAGKTTMTEKLLLWGKAIQLAGSVKSRKASRYATSDWMEMEKQRGISVTTSVMQFPYHDCIINLLDTPGHADFSEDTYRTLTAVDCALMVIDAAKGVEERTIKLLEVCRLRNTPILTFINKLDRDSKEPIELLDEIESVLNIECAPINWPIGSGKEFVGAYDLYQDKVHLFQSGFSDRTTEYPTIDGIESNTFDEVIQGRADDFRSEIELVRGASHQFDREAYLAGRQSPVFFGSALANFGVKELLDAFVEYAPQPQPRPTLTGEVEPTDSNFSGFVFKIQANMDPSHHDRVAFLRICSGQYQKGMKTKHVRIGKDITLHNAHTFLAGERSHAEEAWPGDIIGIHNHGTIQIGDTFTSKRKDDIKFIGIPYFAPELFRRVRLRDPLKLKALQKGLQQLSEEGATQVFRPLMGNELIVGAVGMLQFDVVAHRLKTEYRVECGYDNVNIVTARWVKSDDENQLREFKNKAQEHLAYDAAERLVYLAPTMVNLTLIQERWPDLTFAATQEH